MRKLISAAFAAALLFGFCVLNPPSAAAQQGAVTAVSSVDLKRYSGQWFEIAKLPAKFQKQCIGNTTATFSTLKQDGEMEVLSRCLVKNGKTEEARGALKASDGTNAKMKVSFPKFSSDEFWIIDLDSNYQYTAVGGANRDYLWILSRTPQIDDATYQQILRRIETMGFNPNKLIKTSQKVEMLKGTVVEKSK